MLALEVEKDKKCCLCFLFLRVEGKEPNQVNEIRRLYYNLEGRSKAPSFGKFVTQTGEKNQIYYSDDEDLYILKLESCKCESELVEIGLTVVPKFKKSNFFGLFRFGEENGVGWFFKFERKFIKEGE